MVASGRVGRGEEERGAGDQELSRNWEPSSARVLASHLDWSPCATADG